MAQEAYTWNVEERKLILKALNTHKDKKLTTIAKDVLGITYDQLRKRMKTHKIIKTKITVWY